MTAEQTRKDKWESITSKFATCESECITHYRSDQKCKDSIEAVVADIWNLISVFSENGFGVADMLTNNDFLFSSIPIG